MSHPAAYEILSLSPDSTVGRGGISSAVGALMQSEPLVERQAKFIFSHAPRARLKAFRRSLQALRSRRDDPRVVWAHCGPWASILRKALLVLLSHGRDQLTVLHLHSPRVEQYLEWPLTRVLLRRLLLKVDAVIVLTPWWRTLLLRHVPELEGRIAVIPNAVTAALEEVASAAAQSAEPSVPRSEGIRVLSMARLVAEKGVDAVIRALPLLPNDCTLVVAGDGPERPALTRLAATLGVSSRVSFVGWVESGQKLALLRNSDVFCLPSRYDSFGMSFVESMAAGTPVVALRQGAVPDVVQDNVTGILVESPSAQEVADGIRRAIKESAGIVARARTEVLRRYVRKAVGNSLVDFLDAIWNQRGTVQNDHSRPRA